MQNISYTKKETKSFKDFWEQRVNQKQVFEDWQSYAHQLVTHIQIDPDKIRMALRSSPVEAMIIIGMANALTYKEEKDISVVGFLTQRNFLDTTNLSIKHHSTFNFADDFNLERFEIQDWLNVPEELLNHHKVQVSNLYDRVKDSKLAEWNKEASTTNNYLKYLIYSNNAIIDQNAIHKMEFFNTKDFEVLQETRGKKYLKENIKLREQYDYLKKAYEKNQYWANQVKRDLFPNGVEKTIKKPTNQANNFDGYIWSRIYPTPRDKQIKWLAFTVGISEYHFEVKIDTVGLDDNDVLRQKYFEERGDFYNSEIVYRYPIESINGWLELIRRSKQDIKKMIPQYERLKNLGSNLPTPNLSNMNEASNISLNQILYGPPGTGKTFKLQHEYFGQFTVSESSLTKEQYFENLVADLTWWQTFAVALQDLGLSNSNAILNHEIVRAKERLSSAKTIKPILWSRLQAHTVLNCPNVNVKTRSEPQLFYKDQSSNWRIEEELLKEQYPEALEILEKWKNYKPDAGKIIKNYEFVTFHQSFGYEDFVEGIKPKMEEQSTDLEYEIQDGIFKRLALKAKADPENNYALFIDEINRGNVSAIFGELITLIEKDKRLGEENELKVKLPYSRTEFGVPPNLYLIGTMNTADRSVEALDTALRRRFSFEEIMPKPELFAEVAVAGFNLQEVLETINLRIEALFDRDHTIGHSYFFKVKDATNKEEALKQVFKDNIIPLLQEYFYGDYSRIGLVLGEGFVKQAGQVDDKIFAKFKDTNDSVEVSERYELIPINEQFNIGIALEQLTSNA